MPTTTRKESQAEAEKSAVQSDFAPLYAVAGLTDVVATTLRQALVHAQERAAQRVSELRGRPAQLEHAARANADEISRLLRSAPQQAKALPETTRARIVELQRQMQAYLDEATQAYAELAGRGKRAVDETIGTARNLSARAERAAEDVRADVADAVDPTLEQVQETVTVARKKATGRTSTPTVTSRTEARRTAATVAAAARTAAERAADQRVSAEKQDAAEALAEQEAATRAAEEQLKAEKAAVRKAAAKRAAATRAAARKAAEAKAAENRAAEEHQLLDEATAPSAEGSDRAGDQPEGHQG